MIRAVAVVVRAWKRRAERRNRSRFVADSNFPRCAARGCSERGVISRPYDSHQRFCVEHYLLR